MADDVITTDTAAVTAAPADTTATTTTPVTETPKVTAADPKAAASVLTDPGADPGPGPAAFPDNWRETMAGDDAALLKRLQRMASPLDVAKTVREQDKKISAGIKPKDFPTDGTDEQKQAWRKEYGIPDAPTDYLEDASFDDGLVFGETDKPAVDEFLSTMHEHNADPKYVKAALNTYLKIREKEIQAVATRDREEETKTRDALRDEMGKDFTRNLTAAYGLLQAAPEDVRNNILGARLSNGTRLGNDAGALKWLTGLALEVNPAATVVPGGTATSINSIETEIAQIEKARSDDRNAYERNETMQKRYLELLEARDKVKKRAAA